MNQQLKVETKLEEKNMEGYQAEQQKAAEMVGFCTHLMVSSVWESMPYWKQSKSS